MKYIELKNIAKTFNNRKVLDDISFDINSGDFVVLQGANGSGKSTLLKIITGLLQADFGKVKLFGESPHKSSAKKNIGVVLQNVNVPEKVTVRELINLLRSYYSNSLTTEEIIQIVNLQSKQDDYASKLSGGQKQRLYFALALAGNPDLLILDEPTRNLDRSGCEDFWQQVKKCREEGITILMVTNNQSDWQKLDCLATRLINLENGKITEEKIIEENVTQPRKSSRYLAKNQSPFVMLSSQIKFELLQWYRDILPIIGLIIISGLVAYLLPSDGDLAKPMLLMFASITCLTFAIDKVGSRIAAERIEGWENLLRITPLKPIVYLTSKIFAPLLLMTINLFVILGLSAIKTIDRDGTGESLNIFFSLAVGIIPFLIVGIALGYLVRPKIFGVINGLSVLVAVITCGIITPNTLFLKSCLVFSPFYHYSQLAMFAAQLGDNSNWILNIFWLIWLSFFCGIIAVWAYQRERAIQS